MNQTLEHYTTTAKRINASHIGRLILPVAAKPGVLSDVKHGLLSTKLWIDGQLVKIPNSRQITV